MSQSHTADDRSRHWRPAAEIIFNGTRASDMTREELLTVVENLNWHIAVLATQSHSALERPSNMEQAARIVEGEIYKDRYRTWPAIPGYMGNRSSDSELVRHCDALANAIRALPWRREPSNDKRFVCGDDFAADAWRNQTTGELKLVAVGQRPQIADKRGDEQ